MSRGDAAEITLMKRGIQASLQWRVNVRQRHNILCFLFIKDRFLDELFLNTAINFSKKFPGLLDQMTLKEPETKN